MADRYRRLYRIRRGKIILGLMQGLGEYFGIDPIILRILAVGLMLVTQAGLAVPILYFICALFIPYKPEPSDEQDSPDDESR